MERGCKLEIKPFRGDSGVYKATEFRAEHTNNDQKFSLCGVGVYHQNGIPERYTRTMIEKIRTLLLSAHVR